MQISLALSPTNPLITGGGVPRYRTFGGVLFQLLEGADGAPLQGADGYYLYGVA